MVRRRCEEVSPSSVEFVKPPRSSAPCDGAGEIKTLRGPLWPVRRPGELHGALGRGRRGRSGMHAGHKVSRPR